MKQHDALYDRLVVVKVGTSTLTTPDQYGTPVLDDEAFRRIGTQILSLTEEDTAVAVVSSAAIAAGLAVAPETPYPTPDTREKQRLACLGQISLLDAWQSALQPKRVGQLLFTRYHLNSFESSELQEVTLRLFEHGDIPVANENDALSHAEITFGDNDILAAHFAALLHRSGIFRRTDLVMLSDVDGVYKNPDNPRAIIPIITDVDMLHGVAQGPTSTCGTGGMASKFEAARIANENGIDTYVANGQNDHAIAFTLDYTQGTRFVANY